MRQKALFFCVILSYTLFGFLPPTSASEKAPFPHHLIILGFDGADPALTERWMEEGYLPHLSRL